MMQGKLESRKVLERRRQAGRQPGKIIKRYWLTGRIGRAKTLNWKQKNGVNAGGYVLYVRPKVQGTLSSPMNQSFL